MTAPNLVVEVGLPTSAGGFILGDGTGTTGSLLDTGTLLDSQGYDWVDVTTYIEGGSSKVQWSRGSSKLQGVNFRYENGRASFRLDNRDGRFDPRNLSSPYVVAGVNPLRPNVPLRVRWQHTDGSSGPENAWRGVTDDWKLGFNADLDAWVEVTASDAPAQLQQDGRALSSAAGAGEGVPARIARILDNAGWDANLRSIEQTTSSLLQATTLADAPWTELLKTVDSDAGYLWVDRDGNVVYRSRVGLPSAPELTFDTAASTGPKYEDVEWEWGFDSIRNAFVLSRAGGIQQTQYDSASQAKYGYQSYERNDLLNASDMEVQELANWLLTQWGDQGLRAVKVVVRPMAADDTATWNALLRADVGTAVRINHTTVYGQVLTYDAIISAVSWKVSADRDDWEGEFALFPLPVLPTTGFILSSPLYGVLDNNLLA